MYPKLVKMRKNSILKGVSLLSFWIFKKNKIPYSDMELLIVRYKIRSHISATQKVIITNNTND